MSDLKKNINDILGIPLIFSKDFDGVKCEKIKKYVEISTQTILTLIEQENDKARWNELGNMLNTEEEKHFYIGKRFKELRKKLTI